MLLDKGLGKIDVYKLVGKWVLVGFLTVIWLVFSISRELSYNRLQASWNYLGP